MSVNAYLKLKKPVEVKLVIGLIYSSETDYANAKDKLLKKFGKTDYETDKMSFSETDYYCPEMGRPLYKRLISFIKLRGQDDFVKIKRAIMHIESGLSVKGNRRVNIDPGYLTEAKFVLITTKDYAHRIAIGKGIFAEVTLQYKAGTFQVLPTTYPDFKTDKYISVLSEIRKIYRKQIR
ncbi:MAG: DUF4416 family protein [Candidatus Omnitrophica bacterium]|nr:DUF4416 family protein [Candidatus Omnitrophota bacterium]MDD5080977.1 DUF4416 family protein [Candidatus Omnitrophota bacterium]